MKSRVGVVALLVAVSLLWSSSGTVDAASEVAETFATQELRCNTGAIGTGTTGRPYALCAINPEAYPSVVPGVYPFANNAAAGPAWIVNEAGGGGNGTTAQHPADYNGPHKVYVGPVEGVDGIDIPAGYVLSIHDNVQANTLREWGGDMPCYGQPTAVWMIGTGLTAAGLGGGPDNGGWPVCDGAYLGELGSVHRWEGVDPALTLSMLPDYFPGVDPPPTDPICSLMNFSLAFDDQDDDPDAGFVQAGYTEPITYPGDTMRITVGLQDISDVPERVDLGWRIKGTSAAFQTVLFLLPDMGIAFPRSVEVPIPSGTPPFTPPDVEIRCKDSSTPADYWDIDSGYGAGGSGGLVSGSDGEGCYAESGMELTNPFTWVTGGLRMGVCLMTWLIIPDVETLGNSWVSLSDTVTTSTPISWAYQAYDMANETSSGLSAGVVAGDGSCLTLFPNPSTVFTNVPSVPLGDRQVCPATLVQPGEPLDTWPQFRDWAGLLMWVIFALSVARIVWSAASGVPTPADGPEQLKLF